MGNHGAKTHPNPIGITDAIDLTHYVLDAKVVSAPNPACESLRKQRSPRETPDLYVYMSYRNWDLARKQIDLNRGLDYVSTNRRFSVLHVAVENNAPIELIKRILAKGIDPNVAESLFLQTPLHIVMKVLDEGNASDILDVLLLEGANVNAQAKYGRTPLYCAIKYRVNERSIIRLLQEGAIVRKEELIFAREKSTRQIAQLLEKVAVLTCICSAHLKRPTPRLSTIGVLPKELIRELKSFLYYY